MTPTWTLMVLALMQLGCVVSRSTLHPAFHPRSMKNVRNRVIHTVRVPDDILGEREVSFHLTTTDMAVIEGDIIHGPAEDLLNGNTSSLAATLSKERRAFTDTSYLWPNAHVIYKFDSNATEQALRQRLADAIDGWRSYAPWLTFEARPFGATPESGVAIITADGANSCCSSIGLSGAGTAGGINLPSYCDKHAIMHELGRLLGFFHEHQRPDREGTVMFLCENLDPACKNGAVMPPGRNCCPVDAKSNLSSIPHDCCRMMGQFNTLKSSHFDTSQPYDTMSIMHYGVTAAALPHEDIFWPAHGDTATPGLGEGPSQGDIEGLCCLYRSNCDIAHYCESQHCPTACV